MANERLHAARTRDLAAAIEAITAAASAGEVIEVLGRTARRLVGADGISVVLREGDFCHYAEEDAIGPLWKGQRFLAEVCISGWAMIHREAAVISDIELDPRIPHALYRETFVRSLVMAPMMAGSVVGALGAYWSEVHQPSELAVTTLEALARFAGLSLARIGAVEAFSRGGAPTG